MNPIVKHRLKKIYSQDMRDDIDKQENPDSYEVEDEDDDDEDK